ncbi:hypothetical protein GCM10010218_31580 [Streptomyces mashuensis]|uniref:Integral membrane protein n=1 Tax=Streptomyces mashuensis TaxID=33904 RepID=A0A919EDD3_9ACTN|nr:hypothetical protein [Streptomyces mashuensis]GHF47840.1 hypothetical protein GCM10010218_31580 [Streptomyces mashuensis]
MPDRRRHAAHRPPLPLPTAPALREEQRDNPFAAPPEDRPDQPWQPRRPAGDGEEGGNGTDGPGDRPAWGSQWSNRQPDRQGDGWGGPGGPSGGPGGGMRWDPTDPAQRRARYALLAGMWGFFFALFGIPQVALLLGALSVYWGVSSLRAKAKPRDPDTPLPPPTPGGLRPQTTAAVSGLVTGGLALAIVAATFAFHLVYRDYYTCVDDALTQKSQDACVKHLPKRLRPLLGNQD